MSVQETFYTLAVRHYRRVYRYVAGCTALQEGL